MTAATDTLLAKSKLTVVEMSQLIADSLSALPNVRSVAVDEDSGIAVRLAGGQVIEFQTVPVAHAMNASLAERRLALDALVKRCA